MSYVVATTALAQQPFSITSRMYWTLPQSFLTRTRMRSTGPLLPSLPDHDVFGLLQDRFNGRFMPISRSIAAILRADEQTFLHGAIPARWREGIEVAAFRGRTDIGEKVLVCTWRRWCLRRLRLSGWTRRTATLYDICLALMKAATRARSVRKCGQPGCLVAGHELLPEAVCMQKSESNQSRYSINQQQKQRGLTTPTDPPNTPTHSSKHCPHHSETHCTPRYSPPPRSKFATPPPAQNPPT